MSMNIEGKLRTEWFNSNFQPGFSLFIFKRQMGNCWNICWNVALFRTTRFEVTKRTSKQSVSWMSSEGEISNNDGRMLNCMNWYHFEICLDFLLSKKRQLLQARNYSHLFYSCFYVHKDFLTTQRKVQSFFFSKKTECPKAAKTASVFLNTNAIASSKKKTGRMWMILETHRYRKYSNFELFSTFDEKLLRDGTVHRVLKMHQNGKNHAKKVGSFQ